MGNHPCFPTTNWVDALLYSRLSRHGFRDFIRILSHSTTIVPEIADNNLLQHRLEKRMMDPQYRPPFSPPPKADFSVKRPRPIFAHGNKKYNSPPQHFG